MTDVVIAGAARTAIGSYGKSLKGVAPSDLGATAATAALERAGVAPEQVEHVVFGNVLHTEPGDAYMARVVGMKAGIPKETPAYTVNRLCGTGVQSIVSACQSIQTGEASVALAGGAESMTFQGLAGIGDLIATSYSPLSRNRRLGELIAGGTALEDSLAQLGETAEGATTIPAALRLAERLGVEMPITEGLERILYEGAEPLEEVRSLMEREPRSEH